MDTTAVDTDGAAVTSYRRVYDGERSGDDGASGDQRDPLNGAVSEPLKCGGGDRYSEPLNAGR